MHRTTLLWRSLLVLIFFALPLISHGPAYAASCTSTDSYSWHDDGAGAAIKGTGPGGGANTHHYCSSNGSCTAANAGITVNCCSGDTCQAGSQTENYSCVKTTTQTCTYTPPSNPVSVSCSASPASLPTGSTATWTASVSGGTGPYTYSWGGADGLNGLSGSSANVVYQTAGTKNGAITVTDSTVAPDSQSAYTPNYGDDRICTGPVVAGYGSTRTEDYAVLDAGANNNNGNAELYRAALAGFNPPPDFPQNENYCVTVELHQQACNGANCIAYTDVENSWHTGTASRATVSSDYPPNYGTQTKPAKAWYGTVLYTPGSAGTPQPQTATASCSNSVTVYPANTAPNVPYFSYLYDDASGQYVGSTGYAYHDRTYTVAIAATDPDGDNVALRYQLYNAQTGQIYDENWANPVWNGSGSWASVASFQNYPPGTYYVRAYSYDTSGATSAWSDWQPITLVPQSCTSPANACGQTQAGTMVNGSCNVGAPSNSGCAPPNVPYFSYLYDDANGAYVGSTGEAYHPSQYRVYIAATDPNAFNVALRYQLYSPYTGTYEENWAPPVWVGSGSWASVDSFQNVPPGTYYVRAYSYNALGASSAWSDWQPIYLNTVGCTSPANACGQTQSGTMMNGTCNVGAPANPANYGQACSATSPANACGQTTTASGTYGCSGACSAAVPAAPSNGACTPNVPTFSYLYTNDTAAYVSPSANAYYAPGYRVYMNATTADGSNVAIRYQLYDAQTGQTFAENWAENPAATFPWYGSGSWTYTANFANYPPGTYYVRAYSYNGSGVISAWSAWQPITLTTPAISASCSASPTSIYEGQSMTWSANNVSGGSGTYAYSWSGTDGLSGNTASVSNSYSTSGTKSASLTVTSAGLSTTVNCDADANPNDGHVTVTSCNPSLSANPSTVDIGQATDLNWSTPSACSSSCVFSDGHAVSGHSGSYTVTPPTPSSGNTDIYAITCPSGSNKTAQTSVTVLVPTVSITATPARVQASTGGAANSTITWTASNVNSCSITKNGSAWTYGATTFTNLPADPSRAVNGSSPDAVTVQSTYKITCTNNAGQVSATATAVVNVVPQFEEF